jgi:hypothetical protein
VDPVKHERFTQIIERKTGATLNNAKRTRERSPLQNKQTNRQQVIPRKGGTGRSEPGSRGRGVHVTPRSVADSCPPLHSSSILCCAHKTSGGTRAVRSNRFRFDSIFDSKGAETFRFDSISIRFNLRFDSIKNLCCSAEKNYCNCLIGQSSRGIHLDVRNNWQNHLRLPCVKFSLFTVIVLDFLFQNLLQIESNRMESKIEKKKNIRFDLDTIRFDLSQNIRFDNRIRFDFDSI